MRGLQFSFIWGYPLHFFLEIFIDIAFSALIFECQVSFQAANGFFFFFASCPKHVFRKQKMRKIMMQVVVSLEEPLALCVCVCVCATRGIFLSSGGEGCAPLQRVGCV